MPCSMRIRLIKSAFEKQAVIALPMDRSSWEITYGLTTKVESCDVGTLVRPATVGELAADMAALWSARRCSVDGHGSSAEYDRAPATIPVKNGHGSGGVDDGAVRADGNRARGAGDRNPCACSTLISR